MLRCRIEWLKIATIRYFTIPFGNRRRRRRVIIWCDVSKFNNTNNFIILYLRILLLSLSLSLSISFVCVFLPFLSIFTIIISSHCVRESVSLLKYIKWPHDSILEYVLFELVCAGCFFVRIVFACADVIIITPCTLHTQTIYGLLVYVPFWLVSVHFSFIFFFILFVCSFYYYFIAGILFSLLTRRRWFFFIFV